MRYFKIICLVSALLVTSCVANKTVNPLSLAAFPESGIYIYQPGDSASGIALKLGLSMKMLSEFNPGIEKRRLKIGDWIHYAPPQKSKPQKIETPFGKVYLDVLLSYPDSRCLFYVTFTKDETEPWKPWIKQSDIAVKIFDQRHKRVSYKSNYPPDVPLVEVGGGGGSTANAIFELALSDGQKPTSAEVSWLGKTYHFSHITLWMDSTVRRSTLFGMSFSAGYKDEKPYSGSVAKQVASDLFLVTDFKEGRPTRHRFYYVKEGKPELQFDNPVNDADQTETNAPVPSLGIDEALAIAKTHIKNQRLDISDSYVDSVKFERFPPEKEGKFWLITYLDNRYATDLPIKGGQLYVRVYLDRTVKVLHGE